MKTSPVEVLRNALIECDRRACMQRVWGGMGWSWGSLHAKAIHEVARKALDEVEKQIDGGS